MPEASSLEASLEVSSAAEELSGAVLSELLESVPLQAARLNAMAAPSKSAVSFFMLLSLLFLLKTFP